MKYLILFSSLCLLAFVSYAQNRAATSFYFIEKAEEEIIIDGTGNESTWQKAKTGRDFYQIFPTDTLPAGDSTHFSISYDDKFLYILFEMYGNMSKKPTATSLRRDFSFGGNENIAIYIDPFNDHANGFTFQVTPYNVQREGLVTLGGRVADDWDNKWFSATQIDSNKWTAEIAVPFSSIRYNSTSQWAFQVLRNNLYTNERSTWIRVPQQYTPSDLLYAGNLIWDSPPPTAGKNISLIPYINAAHQSDLENNIDPVNRFNAGFDAKIGVSNSLNLDLTFNPDFSQVEVDRQVTNLNRFELFFPERRQFFLENQDLFATNGFPNSRPFFSRRIGIGTDPNGISRQIPILGGARLSGKIGRDWRVGALNMQTQADDIASIPAQNYGLAILQRQLFNRSNVSAIVVNRQTVNADLNDTLSNISSYNRVFGIDYNLASENNKWEGNYFYHRSIDPVRRTNAYASGAFIRYRVREFSLRYNHTMIGEGYNAEVGFVPRKGVNNFGLGGEYNFYPKSGKIQRHGPELSGGMVTTTQMNKLDMDANASYRFIFLNSAYFEVGTNYSEIFLQFPFDPTRSGKEPLPAQMAYKWFDSYVFVRTDQRKQINFAGSFNHGGFFNGTRTRINGTLETRYQPYFAMALTAEYNNIVLPAPYNSADFYLIGPRIDMTLTTKLFFTTFLQYNTQAENFNINTRLQWRFKPVSDIFLVYTDNYDTVNFGLKNRALVFKISYWFNV